jgi:hypothetical protein
MLQQQQGLNVEDAGPSVARGTDTCLAAAAAGVAASGAAAAAAGVGADQGDAMDASGGDDAGGQKGGGGIGQYKQQVFEAARKQLGATAGDLARSDALVLEVVLGEGSFGKVFRGESLVRVHVKAFCMSCGAGGMQSHLAHVAERRDVTCHRPTHVQQPCNTNRGGKGHLQEGQNLLISCIRVVVCAQAVRRAC